jgi:hypothetical protein
VGTANGAEVAAEWLARLAAAAAVAAWAVTAVLAGRPVLRRVAPDLDHPFPALVLALVGQAYLVLLLGLAGLLHAPVVVGLWIVAAAWGVRDARRTGGLAAALGRASTTRGGSRRPERDPLLRGAAILILVFALLPHLAPLLGNDALVYHARLPREWAEAGRIARVPWNVYSNMPANGEMLYTFAWLLGGEGALRMAHFGLLAALAWGVAALTGRFLPAGRGWAPVLLLTTPLCFDARTVGNVDLALALFTTAAAWAYLEARASRSRRALVAAGLFLGGALGVKYTAAGIAAAFAAVLLLETALDARAAGRRISLGTLAADLAALTAPAAALLLPWLVKNAALTGNPVYPLAVGTFGEPTVLGSPEWDAESARRLTAWQHAMGMGRSIVDYLLLPWRAVTLGLPNRAPHFYSRFDGTLNPLFLALVPGAVLMARRGSAQGRRGRPLRSLLLVSAMLFVFWAAGPQQLRFLLPAVPLLAVACAPLIGAPGILRGKRGGSSGPARATTALALVLTALLAWEALVPSLSSRAASVVGVRPREDYLARNLPPYEAFQAVDARVPPDARLLLIWENRTFHLRREHLADSFFEASQVMALARRAGSADALAGRLRAMGVTHVLWNVPLGRHFGELYDDGTRSILDDFGRDHLSPEFSANGLVLGALE